MTSGAGPERTTGRGFPIGPVHPLAVAKTPGDSSCDRRGKLISRRRGQPYRRMRQKLQERRG